MVAGRRRVDNIRGENAESKYGSIFDRDHRTMDIWLSGGSVY